MSELSSVIFKILKQGKDIILVGPGDSGKTWFVENTFIPYLKSRDKNIRYFKDPDGVSSRECNHQDFVVVDEVESLQDRKFLEAQSPHEKPYYSEAYEAKVNCWFEKLKVISCPGIYVISRNKKAIPHFMKTVHSLDWKRDLVEVIDFQACI